MAAISNGPIIAILQNSLAKNAKIVLLLLTYEITRHNILISIDNLDSFLSPVANKM